MLSKKFRNIRPSQSLQKKFANAHHLPGLAAGAKWILYNDLNPHSAPNIWLLNQDQEFIAWEFSFICFQLEPNAFQFYFWIYHIRAIQNAFIERFSLTAINYCINVSKNLKITHKLLSKFIRMNCSKTSLSRESLLTDQFQWSERYLVKFLHKFIFFIKM